MTADKVTQQRAVRRLAVLLAGIVLLIAILLLAVVVGAVSIPLRDVWLALQAPGTTDDYRIIYTLRIPRGLCAALAGANLALSGCILQGVLRNPLADPGIIGVSGGAALGAALAIVLLAPLGQQLQALLGLGLLPLLAAEQMVTAMSANWQRFCNQMNKAA